MGGLEDLVEGQAEVVVVNVSLWLAVGLLAAVGPDLDIQWGMAHLASRAWLTQMCVQSAAG